MFLKKNYFLISSIRTIGALLIILDNQGSIVYYIMLCWL